MRNVCSGKYVQQVEPEGSGLSKVIFLTAHGAASPPLLMSGHHFFRGGNHFKNGKLQFKGRLILQPILFEQCNLKGAILKWFTTVFHHVSQWTKLNN